jgi:concentrative nucleoside transporter, CNT family
VVLALLVLPVIAILLGGLAQIAPKRRGSVARLGVRAVLAGTLANLLNAAVAGMF